MRFSLTLALIVGFSSAFKLVKHDPEPEQPNQYNRICDATVKSNVGCKAQCLVQTKAQTKRVCDAVDKQEGCFESLEHRNNNTPITTGWPAPVNSTN